MSAFVKCCAVAVTIAFSGPKVSLADIQFDLRVSSVSGPGIQLADTKHVLVSQAGGIANIDLYAVVIGKDANSSNEGIQDVRGYILAPLGDGPTGHLGSGVLVSPFNGLGSVPGSNTDVNADSFRDLGTLDASASTSIVVRSNVMTVGGPDFRLYTFSLPISRLGNGNSLLNFTRTAIGVVTILWQEDNVGKNTTNGNVILGIPITFTTVPEPMSAAILNLGAIVVLTRRRRVKDASAKNLLYR